MFFRGIFSTKFWFNRTSKISAVEGVRDLHVSRTLQSGLNVGLEHLKIETRLIDERVASVMCECVI